MTQNTSLRGEAIFWWNELHPFDKMKVMNTYGIDNYRTSDSLTGREIETVYLKEQETKFNLWKESNPNGIWEEWMKQFHPDNTLLPLYLKEHPTEVERYDYTKLPMNPNPTLPNWMNGKAEVSKEEETLHDYALKYASFEFDKHGKMCVNVPEGDLHRILRSGVKAGANWQKEKTKN